MDVTGAAIATVAAQAVSVLLSPAHHPQTRAAFFLFQKDIRFDRRLIGKIVKLGSPIALQDLLVSISFLVIPRDRERPRPHRFGGHRRGGKAVRLYHAGAPRPICSPCPHSWRRTSARTSRKGKGKRFCTESLSSLAAGVLIATFPFFHGSALAAVFARDAAVISAAADYLRAYAIDCLLTSFLFCFMGYFNGCGKTFS